MEIYRDAEGVYLYRTDTQGEEYASVCKDYRSGRVWASVLPPWEEECTLSRKNAHRLGIGIYEGACKVVIYRNFYGKFVVEERDDIGCVIRSRVL